MHPKSFSFERSRGVVWVCDIIGSSKNLNDNKNVDALEQFLPRLHWVASLITDSAMGRFIKWTGDGFLSWFETPLHRHIGERSSLALDAAWHLSLLVNVTQLGVKTKRKFKIRHGITYEHDALITKMEYPGSLEFIDITGRSVVLAFRLSSVECSFPSIVTQRDLVEATRDVRLPGLHFKKWNPTAEERLKYFKGENWGMASIYKSTERRPRSRSVEATIKSIRNTVNQAEGRIEAKHFSYDFVNPFLNGMFSGPKWSRVVVKEYMRFVREDLLGNLKSVLPALEKIAKSK